jgi:hypothetical protein
VDLVSAHPVTSAAAPQGGLGCALLRLNLGNPSADDAGIGAGVQSGAVAVQAGMARRERFAGRVAAIGLACLIAAVGIVARATSPTPVPADQLTGAAVLASSSAAGTDSPYISKP